MSRSNAEIKQKEQEQEEKQAHSKVFLDCGEQMDEIV
jgi:hypothetical protein